MSDSAPGLVQQEETRPDVDAMLLGSIARWAIVVSLLIFLYDLAVLAGWPFLGFLDDLRGVFYVAVGVVLVLATMSITFLGYRIVTMRVAGRSKVVYLIFLPGVALVTSIVGMLLLAAPR